MKMSNEMEESKENILPIFKAYKPSVESQIEALGLTAFPEDHFPTTAVYLSVQGEGPKIGIPTVFVRFVLCNLHCGWCDTKYTWAPPIIKKDLAAGKIKNYKPDELFEHILDVAGNARNVVFTGGEPTLHQVKLAPLIERLGAWGITSEIETNGTQVPTAEMLQNVSWNHLTYNLSPKLSNNRADTLEGRKDDAMAVYKELGLRGKAFYKFVITKPEDMDEVQKEWIDYFQLPESQMIMMPEGVRPEDLMKHSEWLVELCKERGWRFTPRLQVLLYGSKIDV